MRRAELLETFERHRAELHALGAQSLWLFGSAARDEARPDSDVDLVVDLDQPNFDRYMDLKLFLEDLVHAQVDLAVRKSLDPRLLPHISREWIHVA